MDNVLGYDDIRSNVSTLNKGSLSWVNDMGEVMFDAINQSFSNNFVADVALTNRAKVFQVPGVLILRIRAMKVLLMFVGSWLVW